MMGGTSSIFASSRSNATKRALSLKMSPDLIDSWGSNSEIYKLVTANTEEDFTSWNFDIWTLHEDHFITLSMIIIQSFNLPKSLGLKAENWFYMMSEVRYLMGTTKNPYHNFTHVMDVTQTCSTILKLYDGAQFFNDLDIFSLLVSAVVHDLEHPGLNNTYQINAGTVLALRYNDISVLENHHCAKAFELLSLPELDIFQSFTIEQRRASRKIIISMVLATDMTVHFSLKDELDKFVIHYKESKPEQLNEKEKLTVLKSILHTADISNPAKAWAISKKWSDLVVQEFFNQGDKEKAEGLPVSMNCDRNTTKQDELSINFADFIVAPFFFSITKLLPKMITVCNILEENRSTWHEMVAKRVTTAVEEAKVSGAEAKEVMEKWDTRKTAFTGKLNELTASLSV